MRSEKDTYKWISDDITFCDQKCEKDCFRNIANKNTETTIFSVANFKGTDECMIPKLIVSVRYRKSNGSEQAEIWTDCKDEESAWEKFNAESEKAGYQWISLYLNGQKVKRVNY